MLKNFLTFLLFAILLASPLVGLAVAQPVQQQIYPGVGGQNLVGSSASGSIPALVKYIFNLIVWVCILAAILVLIAGGVQYVTSVGDVGKMTGAKTRIYSSLLGLTILIGAWFVLHTMNPSLVIPSISYVPLREGIVFFTADGYCRFRGYVGMDASGSCSGNQDTNVDASIINDLIQANQAKFIDYSTPDLTSVFGQLSFYGCGGSNVKMNSSFLLEGIEPGNANTFLNFTDFPMYTFALWGKKAQGAKLFFYNKTNYENLDNQTIPLTYTYQGLLDRNENPISGTRETHKNIKDIIIIKPKAFGELQSPISSFPYFGNILGVNPEKKVYFYNKAATSYLNAANYVLTDSKDFNKGFNGSININGCGSGTYVNAMANQKFRDGAVESSPKSILHPPLSVKIIWSSPGVYLTDSHGDERYFDASANDFKDPSINFATKATEIKIINDIPAREYVDENGDPQKAEPEYHDFLAILHENDNFSGNLKIYFEQRMYKDKGNDASSKAKDKLIPAYTICGNAVSDRNSVYLSSPPDSNTLYTISPETDYNIVYGQASQALKVNELVSKKGNFYFWNQYNFGHLPKVLWNNGWSISSTKNNEHVAGNNGADNLQYKVNEEERYGKLEILPSSIEVFELADDPNVCKEVKICTEKSGLGYCLAYTNDNGRTDNSAPNIVYFPMPNYLPVPLPYGNFKLWTNGSEICPDQLLPTFLNADNTTKKVEFANKIKSIVIDGKCAVVLFGGMENPSFMASLGDVFNFFKLQINRSGQRNEVFTSSDYNLEDNQIGMCGSTGGFGRWFSQSCAVAIAVYPIK